MKRILVFAFLSLVIVFSSLAQELTVDQIIEKHLKAMGNDIMLKVNTIISSGHITRQDYMPLKIIRMRPNKYKMEFDMQDITAYQAYDGTNAWMTAPWTGNMEPQVLTGGGANDMKSKAEFDVVFYQWKEKGHNAELMGKEDYNGLEVYKIKLTQADGTIEYYFIDSRDFILQKKISYRKTRNGEMEVLTMYSDYRDIQGMKFAFYTESLMGGQPYSTIEYETIEINTKLDEKVFSMPTE
ncbi:MAG: hypothetical protein CVU05_14065 [Bacteroidetes bacterium HGW-Bacteroidetes-21]|nr:MAG: hypothetical protein CVU05_14065 [Bacteroidetes bacterium HGW-Bacteroidetes-21]